MAQRLCARHARRMCALSVVVVDDDAVMRELLAMLIGDHPCLDLAGTADSGAAALDLISDVAPDVLICDYDLGDMPADGVIAHVRAVSAHTRIVLHSGRADVHELGRTRVSITRPARASTPADWSKQCTASAGRRSRAGTRVRRYRPTGRDGTSRPTLGRPCVHTYGRCRRQQRLDEEEAQRCARGATAITT